jgi:hypothetical protein
MKNATSIGRPEVWGMVAAEAMEHPNHWRKVARFLNQVRRRWISSRPPARVKRETFAYARQAFRDTKFPTDLRHYVRRAVAAEFNFDIERA